MGKKHGRMEPGRAAPPRYPSASYHSPMQDAANRYERKRRVAFYGGSFDPPHRAHLEVARAARKALGLDSVLFAPVGTQPLKPTGASANFAQRVAMTRLAIAGKRGFEISLADAPQPDGRPNFTIDTLRALQRKLGSACELFCLMGADSLANLPMWRQAEEIPFVASLVVAARPGEDLRALASLLPKGVSLGPAMEVDRSSALSCRAFPLSDVMGRKAQLYLLPETRMETNSTELREQLRNRAACVWRELPVSVARYIRSHRLYR